MAKIKLFHGSKEQFNKFDDTNTFFATESKYAEMFGPIVYSCIADFYNTLYVDANEQSWGGMFLEDELFWETVLNYCICASGGDCNDPNDEEYEYFHEFGITIDYLAEWAKTRGFDGLVVKNVYDDDINCAFDQVVALNMNCIEITKIEKLSKK